MRGIAVKLLGVPGKKVIPGMENATTQDFLLIRTSSTPFRSADEFVPFVMAIASPLIALPRGSSARTSGSAANDPTSLQPKSPGTRAIRCVVCDSGSMTP